MSSVANAKASVWSDVYEDGGRFWGYYVPGRPSQFGAVPTWREAMDEVAHFLRADAARTRSRESQ